MRLFKFASSFVKGLLLAAVLALMLAACGGAAPAPTQATSATPTQSTANPVQPTAQASPTPIPTPTPTSIPYSEMTGLQEMLAREFGEWPMLVSSKQETRLTGLVGIANLHPGDVVAVYKLSDGNVMLTSQDGMAVLKSEDAQQSLGVDVSSAPKVDATTRTAFDALKQAEAWEYYAQHYKLPQHIDGLVDANGQPVDLPRFFKDRNYAVKIVSYYLTHDRKAYDAHGRLVPIKPRTNLDPNRVVDALYALYYNMRFDPKVNFFGMHGKHLFGVNPLNPESAHPPFSIDDAPDLFLGDGSLLVQWPGFDEKGELHKNFDWNPVSNGASTVVYNPSTQPVKVKEVWFWYDESIGSLRQAYESGRLNASVHVMVSPPGGGKPVEFYFAHLDGSKGSLLDELLKSNGFTPLNSVFDFHVGGANTYKLYINGRMSLEPGQEFASLDNPDNDPWSSGPHVEVGTQYYGGVEDYRIATLMVVAMLYHPNPEKYLPPLPKEEGYWFGKKHVVSYQPTVPAVAVRQPDGTVAFANINPYKKEPGWKKQLPASARFSKYPKAAFRRRA